MHAEIVVPVEISDENCVNLVSKKLKSIPKYLYIWVIIKLYAPCRQVQLLPLYPCQKLEF